MSTTIKYFMPVLLSAIFLMTGIPYQVFGGKVITKNKGQASPANSGSSIPLTVDSLLILSRSVLFSNPDSARKIVEPLLKSLPQDAHNQRIRCLTLMGSSYHVQADYGKALDFYSKALSLAIKTGNKPRTADVYNNLGNLNLKTGNYKDALEYLSKALKIYEQLGQHSNEASTLNNMGLLYMNIDNFIKAKEYFARAYESFKLKNDSIGISATLANLGLVQAEGDSAIIYFNRAITIAKLNDNKYGLCISYQGMANLYSTIDNTEMALAYYQKSKNIALQIDHPYQEAYANLGLARVMIKQNKSSDALVLANEALEIAIKIDNKPLTYECHEVLSLVYENAHDYKSSLKHYREFSRIKEQVLSQNLLHQIYNQEISSLSESNTIKQLEIEGQVSSISQKNTIIMFIVVAFVFIFLGLYLFYMNFRHRQNVKLKETIISLSEKKSRAAVEAEIQERKRIGEELHDGLGQMLSVARLNISVLQQKTDLSDVRKRELLNSSLHSVDEAFNELRNISHNLAPTILSQKGLAGAVNDLAAQINQSNRMKMEVEVFGSYDSLDNLIENTLYRAVQELLNNAIKHAKATKLIVQIIKSNSEITLMTEDNGIGFDAEKVMLLSNGGLNNLKSRLENLNGTIFIDSSEDRGTIVSIVIPVKSSIHAERTY